MKKTPLNLVIIGILVVFCIAAGSAFITSYSNLQNLAEKCGIIGFSSFLWPLCLDSSMILGCITTLYYCFIGKRSYQTDAISMLFTLASVILNVANSPNDIIAQVVHATAPLSLYGGVYIVSAFLRTFLNELHSERSHIAKQSTVDKGVLDTVNITAEAVEKPNLLANNKGFDDLTSKIGTLPDGISKVVGHSIEGNRQKEMIFSKSKKKSKISSSKPSQALSFQAKLF